MIYYRLFRKEASVRSTLEFSRPEITESRFIEEISRMIKLLKRREKLAGELQQGKGMEQGQRQNGELVVESEQLLSVLRGFVGEPYFGCKAYLSFYIVSYLYTAFMRVSEIADKGRARCRNEAKNQSDRSYEQMKRTITELYSRQNAEERFDVVQLFELVLKQQNQRIGQLLPKKKVPLQPISNSTKLLDHLRQTPEMLDLRKKSASTEMFKPTTSVKLQQILGKKLLVGPELATSKRLEQRKKQKQKQRRPKVINLFRLYDVLEIRPPAFDRQHSLKEQLQSSMTERNQLVKEAIRQWQRRWQAARSNRRERETSRLMQQ